ncbi:MAG: hypothetical protein LKJ90_02380 [Faecalibacterium sp.]|jgi:glucose dehydrogenase|nr:hypothetical protein [Faecalibacterium sp.]
MAKFWKTHTALRMILTAAAFAAGLALLIAGWRMTGQMSGLLWMLAGLVLLLAALWLYNAAYKD